MILVGGLRGWILRVGELVLFDEFDPLIPLPADSSICQSTTIPNPLTFQTVVSSILPFSVPGFDHFLLAPSFFLSLLPSFRVRGRRMISGVGNRWRFIWMN